MGLCNSYVGLIDGRLFCGLGCNWLKLSKPDPKGKEQMTFEVDNDVPVPVRKVAGAKRQNKYNFDILEIGQSFHIAATAEKPDPIKAIGSSLTGARRKYAEPALDDWGKPVIETVKRGAKEYSRPKVKLVRDFKAAAVDASDPRGAGARVWRIA